MKSIVWAVPWVLVVAAALVYAAVYPPYVEADGSPYYYELKKIALAMLLGGLIVRFGTGLAEGMEEGLKARERPPAR